MTRFDVTPTPIEGVIVVQRQELGDARGFLSRVYCADELRAAGLQEPIAQINLTLTRRRGAVRGMHFQRPPHAEMKLVNCIRGEIFDVVVDLRPRSNTYLTWHSEVLSAGNRRALVVPRGVAHGFQALTDDCELLYLHTAAFAAAAEGALNALDPRLGIRWPLEITEMSDRDRSHPMLTEAFAGIDA